MKVVLMSARMIATPVAAVIILAQPDNLLADYAGTVQKEDVKGAIKPLGYSPLILGMITL